MPASRIDKFSVFKFIPHSLRLDLIDPKSSFNCFMLCTDAGCGGTGDGENWRLAASLRVSDIITLTTDIGGLGGGQQGDFDCGQAGELLWRGARQSIIITRL